MPGGRLVSLASSGHRFSDVNLEDPNFETTEYTPFGAYGRSKTANILFTVGLDERARERGLRAFAVHPGVILTNLSRHLVEADYEALMARAPESITRPFPSTVTTMPPVTTRSTSRGAF